MNISRQKTWIIIVAIFLVVCASAVLIFHSLYSDMRQEIAITKSTAAVESVRDKFLEIADPISRDLKLLAQWGKSGLIDMNDLSSLNEKFIPFIKTQPMVASLILADIDGREYFLLKEENAWMVRHASPYQPNMKVDINRLDSNGQIKEKTRIERSFDPRTRVWFAGSLQSESSDAVYWTEPYMFKTLKKMGITAAVKWQPSRSKGSITIAAMDISIDVMRRFLETIKITAGSQIMLIRNDGMMMTQPHTRIEDAHNNGFITLNDLPEGLKKDALSLWGELRKNQAVTRCFTSHGKRWWVSFQPLQPESPKTWIGVLIPEADIAGLMNRWWFSYTMLFAATMVVLALLTGVLFWRYTRRFGSNSDYSYIDDKTLADLIKAGESASVEFKSTVRVNLKSGQKDKAIEIAWLKSVTAFMNTEGGTLFVGVADNGDIIGISADDFENNDKCYLHIKNLIQEHIGSEYSAFVHCHLHTIDGKTIVRFSCRKADVPVFLKTGKNEDYYIRSGPSTTKLTMSQMVAYMENRK